MRGQRSAKAPPPAPVLKVTRYDLVTSFMIAIVVGLVIAVVWLTAIWLTNRLPKTDDRVDLELIELSKADDR